MIDTVSQNRLPPASCAQTPLNSGDARGLELIPHGAAAVGAEVERVVVGRNGRDRAEQDRIVSVHHRGDADGGLRPAAAGVVAGPFAERAFLHLVAGMDEALECDLGVGRNGQAGVRHVDHLDRLAEDSAGRFEFALAVWNFQAGEHEHRRMHADDDGDRAGLTALVVLAS